MTQAILPRSDKPFLEVDSEGKVHHRFHPGHSAAWASKKRFILMLAGTRGGKSCFEAPWLRREMAEKGPGDYLLCAPTFKILDKAAVPYLNYYFNTLLNLGIVKGGSQGFFEISAQGHWSLFGVKRGKRDQPSRIVFGHADDPDSLEAANYKAAVCDEAGQGRFKQESWEAIQRRLSTTQGRCLFATTPYVWNWIKTEVHDRAARYKKAIKEGLPFDPIDADYDLINFESIQNPAFPLDEWERARRTLPAWKFDMFYRGLYTRPAGAIFDCFDENYHKIAAGYVPDPSWRMYCGIDFGAPNFAAVFIAEEPGTGKLIAFAEYRPNEAKRYADHVSSMHDVLRDVFKSTANEWAGQTGRPASDWTRLPDVCIGGAPSEVQFRLDLNAAGWPVGEPDTREVEIGINRVYAAFQEDMLFISDDCSELLEEISSYSREVDEEGEPISDTIMDKNLYHSCDALRYIVAYIRSVGPVSSITWI